MMSYRTCFLLFGCLPFLIVLIRSSHNPDIRTGIKSEFEQVWSSISDPKLDPFDHFMTPSWLMALMHSSAIQAILRPQNQAALLAVQANPQSPLSPVSSALIGNVPASSSITSPIPPPSTTATIDRPSTTQSSPQNNFVRNASSLFPRGASQNRPVSWRSSMYGANMGAAANVIGPGQRPPLTSAQSINLGNSSHAQPQPQPQVSVATIPEVDTASPSKPETQNNSLARPSQQSKDTSQNKVEEIKTQNLQAPQRSSSDALDAMMQSALPSNLGTVIYNASQSTQESSHSTVMHGVASNGSTQDASNQDFMTISRGSRSMPRNTGHFGSASQLLDEQQEDDDDDSESSQQGIFFCGSCDRHLFLTLL